MAKIDFKVPDAVNPYAADAQGLKMLGLPTPEGEAWAIENVDPKSAVVVRNKMGAAARKLGFTARYRSTIKTGETVSLVFTARELDAPRVRKAKPESEEVAEKSTPFTARKA
jgi:hypothetical protein